MYRHRETTRRKIVYYNTGHHRISSSYSGRPIASHVLQATIEYLQVTVDAQ